ncbi:MAG: hypothetical protein E7644_08615 [Ruminococcaceae bacterium]|nr:hypothetical protein [Oscillospiraceae bacterium]
MKILYQDAAIVVVEKPVGVLSEQGEGAGDSVPALLAPTVGEVLPVHRLDRVVGGVMVYARTKQAAAALSRAVTERRLRKEYLAVVEGAPVPAEGELRDLLFKDARQNKSFVVTTPRKGAREAVLSYRVEETLPAEGGALSLLRVWLDTGRSHQIRVQFASRTHPLVGDGKYGSRRKAAAPALFAAGLSFPHPETGREMTFTATPPAVYPFTLFAHTALEIERKFLIRMPDVAALQAQPGCRVRRMVQTYLLALPGETRRVRRVEEEGRVAYIETRKRRVSALTAEETERELTAEAYAALLEEADPTRRAIEKTRYAFPFAGHTVEVDVYPFWQDRAVLEVELQGEDEALELPDFLPIIKEVTSDKRYKNVNLARELPAEEV